MKIRDNRYILHYQKFSEMLGTEKNEEFYFKNKFQLLVCCSGLQKIGWTSLELQFRFYQVVALYGAQKMLDSQRQINITQSTLNSIAKSKVQV